MQSVEGAEATLPDRETVTAAVIFGCAGQDLAAAEKDFFRDADPLGFILFARNIADPDQVRRLTASLREAVGRDDAPILIDQEGGRVARLRPPHWRAYPPAGIYETIWRRDEDAARQACYLHGLLMGAELTRLGIDVDCAPVLDLRVAGAHDIIGDRSFGATPDQAASLGLAVAEGLMAVGVTPIVKHLPGHGRALADSHLELPHVTTARTLLEQTDFAAFKQAASIPWGMTAHVVYDAIDPTLPATLSATVIDDIIRGYMGFDGFLISDDLSMKALSGGFASRTRDSLRAGCDAVLHCNGAMPEMVAIADTVPALSPQALRRLSWATQMVVQLQGKGLDIAALEREWYDMLAAHGTGWAYG